MYAFIPEWITEEVWFVVEAPLSLVAGALGSAAVSSALFQLTSLLVVSETTS